MRCGVSRVPDSHPAGWRGEGESLVRRFGGSLADLLLGVLFGAEKKEGRGILSRSLGDLLLSSVFFSLSSAVFIIGRTGSPESSSKSEIPRVDRRARTALYEYYTRSGREKGGKGGHSVDITGTSGPRSAIK